MKYNTPEVEIVKLNLDEDVLAASATSDEPTGIVSGTPEDSGL